MPIFVQLSYIRSKKEKGKTKTVSNERSSIQAFETALERDVSFSYRARSFARYDRSNSLPPVLFASFPE